MDRYTIKPLEWEPMGPSKWFARTVFGTVYILSKTVVVPDRFVDPKPIKSRDHGKQLAWEWYKAKLGEALTRIDTN